VTRDKTGAYRYCLHSAGYDALFDVSCYSCDLGVAKPDPGFFAAAGVFADIPAR
jgi:FMN phosphatase YigB (HAD superfamily)